MLKNGLKKATEVVSSLLQAVVKTSFFNRIRTLNAEKLVKKSKKILSTPMRIDLRTYGMQKESAATELTGH